MGLVLAAMVGSIDVGTALAKNDKHDKGRYEQRGRGHDRHHRGHAYGHDRRYYGHYGHRERGYYPPPPVVYAPPPAPGISVFFPPIFIHP